MSLVKFHPSSIELVNTAEKFAKKFGTKPFRKGNEHFGQQIIELVMTINIDAENVQGVRICVKKLIQHLRWKNYLFYPISLGETGVLLPSLGGGLAEGDSEQLTILADSVILTSIRKSMGLHSPNSSLRHAIYIDFLNGFEIVCFWASQVRDLNKLEETLENNVVVRVEKHTHEFYESKMTTN